ncbi:MAG: JmjC domain-containing protein [bacterium]
MIHLNNFDAEHFMAHYWQKKAVIMRQAWNCLPVGIDENDLAGLAMEEMVQSRLVRTPEGSEHCWKVENGPFEEQTLTSLPDQGWTLLVNDLDKWFWEIGDYLKAFEFLPSWRIDDIMMSFSADGGSVGPHIDQYDVFLIQTQGQKRWQIAATPECEEIYSDCDLATLKHFNCEQEWILEPGDILYLPPNIPHYGTAIGKSTTLSVGMRSPTALELFDDLLSEIEKSPRAEKRFSDPNRSISTRAGYIDQQSREKFHAILHQLIDNDSEIMNHWVGRMLTRYRLPLDTSSAQNHTISQRQLNQLFDNGQSIYRSPWSRFAWTEGMLFVSGEEYPCNSTHAEFICTHREIDSSKMKEIKQPQMLNELLSKLMGRGHFTADE